MINTREIILTLQDVYAERKKIGNPISYDQILKKIEENGDHPIAKSSISRVLKKGSENDAISYEKILRPIAKVLLDIEKIEEDDDIDTRGYKSIINFKKELLFEYERQIEELKEQIKEVEQREKAKYYEKLANETDKFQQNLAFLNRQVELKDHRIDHLLDANQKLLDQLLMCNKCRERANEGRKTKE